LYHSVARGFLRLRCGCWRTCKTMAIC
jgi:hypothetical protein